VVTQLPPVDTYLRTGPAKAQDAKPNAMPALILLVATDKVVLHRTEDVLSEAGYLVAAVNTFERAKMLLDSVSPDLLIADVRLDAFNGLHLAVRSRIDHPLLPVIITHAAPDTVLENEAIRQGASFIVQPLENPEFLPRVEAALELHGRQQPTIRRWPRKRVGGVVEAELAAASVRICDVSYGGLRIAFGDERSLPEVFDVTVPQVGVTVKARSVWSFRSPTTDEFWCGAEVLDTGAPEMSDWRDFVDAS
jgi:DNA-binding response OmpR family regulator